MKQFFHYQKKSLTFSRLKCQRQDVKSLISVKPKEFLSPMLVFNNKPEAIACRCLVFVWLMKQGGNHQQPAE